MTLPARPLRWMRLWLGFALCSRPQMALMVAIPLAGLLASAVPEPEAPQPPGPVPSTWRPYWYTADKWLMMPDGKGGCAARTPSGASASASTVTCFMENERFADFDSRKPRPLPSEAAREGMRRGASAPIMLGGWGASNCATINAAGVIVDSGASCVAGGGGGGGGASGQLLVGNGTLVVPKDRIVTGNLTYGGATSGIVTLAAPKAWSVNMCLRADPSGAAVWGECDPADPRGTVTVNSCKGPDGACPQGSGTVTMRPLTPR